MAGYFQRARVEKVVRNAGAVRVSQDALDKMNEILSDRGMQIAKLAVEISRHSGRKTVQEEDIRIAASK
ncbi:MAG: histone [Candidatus Hodarchaeota archaeon]